MNPHDPNELARHYHRRLCFVHGPEATGQRAHHTIDVVMSGYAVVGCIGVWCRLAYPDALVTWLAALGYLISVVAGVVGVGVWCCLAIHTHQQLAPWCPRCRNGGIGKDGACTPEPGPRMMATR